MMDIEKFRQTTYDSDGDATEFRNYISNNSNEVVKSFYERLLTFPKHLLNYIETIFVDLEEDFKDQNVQGFIDLITTRDPVSAKLCLIYGFDPNSMFCDLPILRIALDYADFERRVEHDFSIPTLLVQFGADIESPDKLGNTILCHYVVTHNSIEARWLLEKGANPNSRIYKDDESFLEYAVLNQDYIMATLLLDYGAIDTTIYRQAIKHQRYTSIPFFIETSTFSDKMGYPFVGE